MSAPKQIDANVKPSQTKVGQYFEYAVLLSLIDVVGESRLRLEENPRLFKSREQFNSFSADDKASAMFDAKRAVEQLLLFEPNLADVKLNARAVNIKLNDKKSDGLKNAKSDNRDIIISHPPTGWEIGLVAKHNHSALKHSRLSQTIDFGKEWLQIPCSQTYFDDIEPVFTRLRLLENQGVLFRDLNDKNDEIYLPVLMAFQKEMLALDKDYAGMVAPRLIQYILGNSDFYRLIRTNNTIEVQVFNFDATLNLASVTEPKIKLKHLHLPTKIAELALKRNNSGQLSPTTLILKCDFDWTVSLRIHNAKSLVESSLKFDIKLDKLPNALQSFCLEI